MNDFTFYFTLGWQHIISLEALDHILFIMALSAVYSVKKWQPELIVLTAFTVCHSITLALSVYDIVRINSRWVEFLIPVTIIATAVFNLFQNGKPGSLKFNYLLAMFFGLIHGLGFANTIRFMLSNDQSIAVPLLGFNMGLEAGQVVVVNLILIAGYLLLNKFSLASKWWTWSSSTIAFRMESYIAFYPWPA